MGAWMRYEGPIIESSTADLTLYQHCSVCLQGDAWKENPLIKCVKCGISVHYSCYGIRLDEITLKKWYDHSKNIHSLSKPSRLPL